MLLFICHYYFKRSRSNIASWIEYFTEEMAFAFEKVPPQMIIGNKKSEKDHFGLLHMLDSKQCKALELFKKFDGVINK